MQVSGGPKRTTTRPGWGTGPLVQDPVGAHQPDRHDRHAEPRADHPDAALNSLISPAIVRLPSGKISSDCPSPNNCPMYLSVYRVPASRWRNREGVEEQRREVVVQAVADPPAEGLTRRMEVRREEFLGHRHSRGVPPAPGQGHQNHRRVHVALVVRREHHRALQRGEVLQALYAQPDEHSPERQNPRRQTEPAEPDRRPGPIPPREIERRRTLCSGGRLSEPSMTGARFKAASGSRLPVPGPRSPIPGARVPVPASRAPPPGRCPSPVTRFLKSPTVRAEANAPSSTIVWKCCSSAMSSSTRSSELKASASTVVASSKSARPFANRASTWRIGSSLATGRAAACSPDSTHARSAVRFSLRVPSVRGRSAPVQIEALLIFW